MAAVTQSYGRHRALILCESVFLPPYASFEWMWTPITWFSREICSPLTEGPMTAVPQSYGRHRALIMRSVFLPVYASFEWMWTPL